MRNWTQAHTHLSRIDTRWKIPSASEPSSGTIKIDGIDITRTFVPQDATLFSGTIRDNIDPFSEYSDERCLYALSRVHLLKESHDTSFHIPSESDDTHGPEAAASITIVPEESQPVITLDKQVSAGGANFSQGQRQLLTMARALLRQSAIIILDEATSSIDYETDAKIQKTIREEFKESLLITIAHRLRTMIDYDRLIVLDNGEVVEFDTPYNLINIEGGVFRNMCLHNENFEELALAAQERRAIL